MKIPKIVKKQTSPKRKYLYNQKVSLTQEEAQSLSNTVIEKYNDGDENIFIDHAADPENANLISSLCDSGKHAPVIDIDVPISVYPSSQLGHNHLYIDKEITWTQYTRILKALAAAGIVEDGYLKACLSKGYSCVRPIGTIKPGSPRGAEVLVENASLRQKLSDKIVENDYLGKQLANSVPDEVILEIDRLKTARRNLKNDIVLLSDKLEEYEKENKILEQKIESLELSSVLSAGTLDPIAYKTTWG
jgi:hypothetical protein